MSFFFKHLFYEVAKVVVRFVAEFLVTKITNKEQDLKLGLA